MEWLTSLKNVYQFVRCIYFCYLAAPVHAGLHALSPKTFP